MNKYIWIKVHGFPLRKFWTFKDEKNYSRKKGITPEKRNYSRKKELLQKKRNYSRKKGITPEKRNCHKSYKKTVTDIRTMHEGGGREVKSTCSSVTDILPSVTDILTLPVLIWFLWYRYILIGLLLCYLVIIVCQELENLEQGFIIQIPPGIILLLDYIIRTLNRVSSSRSPLVSSFS